MHISDKSCYVEDAKISIRTKMTSQIAWAKI